MLMKLSPGVNFSGFEIFWRQNIGKKRTLNLDEIDTSSVQAQVILQTHFQKER
jgi:hypothetical protein